MKVALGTDHGGFVLKATVIEALEKLGHEVIDFGVKEEVSVDYPDYAELVCRAVINKEAEKGVLICGTGIGISIAANKVKGIRCAHITDVFSAEMAARHNDANVIALGGRITPMETASNIIKTFFSTEFEGGRHQGRVDKITALEEKYSKNG